MHATFEQAVASLVAPGASGSSVGAGPELRVSFLGMSRGADRRRRVPAIVVRVRGVAGALAAGLAFDGRKCLLFARVAYDLGDVETIAFVVDLGSGRSPFVARVADASVGAP